MSGSIAVPAGPPRRAAAAAPSAWRRLLPLADWADPTLDAVERELERPETQAELEAWEAAGAYPRSVVARLRAAGLGALHADALPSGSPVPHLSAHHLNALNVMTARCSGSLAVALGVHGLGLLPIYMAARRAQWRHVRERVRAGASSAILLSEWDHGADLRAIRTAAQAGRLEAGRFRPCPPDERETHYRVRGEKHLITGARTAELLVTLVRTAGRRGSGDIGLEAAGDLSLLLIRRDRDPVEARGCPTLAAASADVGHVTFRDVLVPVVDRIGGRGEGFGIVQRALQLWRGCVGSLAAGTASRAGEMAWDHAGSRRLYGAPIVALDAIAEHLLRLSAFELATGALSLKATAAINALGTAASYVTAVAKLACSELAERAVDEGRRILGARALLPGPFGRLVRDVQLYGVLDGSGHLMRQELQWRLQQMASRRAPAPDPLQETAAAYTLAPRPLRRVCRERGPTWVPNVERQAAALASVGGAVPLDAVHELAALLQDTTRRLLSSGRWHADAALRFDAAAALAHLEAMLATAELADPERRRRLDLPPAADTGPLPAAPLCAYALGLLGLEVTSQVMRLMAFAGQDPRRAADCARELARIEDDARPLLRGALTGRRRRSG